MKESVIKQLTLTIVLLCTCWGVALADVVFMDSFEEPVVPVVITNFSATPSTINEGESTLIEWATENAVSCEIMDSADEFDGPVATNGSATLVIASAGSYDFTLSCTGFEGPVSQMLTVEVVVPPCGPSALSGVIQSWLSFWQLEFPLPISDNKFAIIPKTGFRALQFNTGNVIDDGKLTTIETTATDGLRFGTISTCPGDFDVAPECDHVWGIGGGIRWATNGRTGACQLRSNTTYYFNVTYTDGENASTSTCNSSPCITTFQHQNPP